MVLVFMLPASGSGSEGSILISKRALNAAAQTCPECGGTVKVIACIEDPVVIKKILTHLDEKAAVTETIRLPECRAPPQPGVFELG